jgi:tetratricopeptide (TPR) repeat protein
MVNTEADVRPLLAFAQVARRVDAMVIASLLEQRALRALAETADVPKHADRLFNAAGLLQDLHRYDEAVKLYETLLAEAGEKDANLVSNVNLRLYTIYGNRPDHIRAAECLSVALKNLTGILTITRNGQSEAWNSEEGWGVVDWHYYKAAVVAGDQKATFKQLRKIVTGVGTAEGIFLDILEELEKVAAPKEIDAYFERVYAASAGRMAKTPDTPGAKNDLAWLCARSGRRLEEAVKLAEEAVQAKPSEAAYLDTLAEAKFRVGDIDAAIQLETEALRLLPDNTFMKEQLERFKNARATTRPAK